MATVRRDIQPGLLYPSHVSGDASCSWPSMILISGDGAILALNFDPSTEEHALARVTLYDYDGGTILIKNLAWSTGAASASQKVRWRVGAKVLGNEEALTASFGTAGTMDDAVDATPNLNREMIAPDSGAITVAGATAGDVALYLDVWRDATDATNDTISGDCRLHGFILEYTTT